MLQSCGIQYQIEQSNGNFLLSISDPSRVSQVITASKHVYRYESNVYHVDGITASEKLKQKIAEKQKQREEENRLEREKLKKKEKKKEQKRKAKQENDMKVLLAK